MIPAIQSALQRQGFGGWLFFDHHHRDPLAYRILHLSSDAQASRRWYYFVPADGLPCKLVHRIESHALDSLPGREEQYSSWQEQQSKLCEMLRGAGKIAMQYSPNCAIPYVATVDAGTVELTRTCGVEIVSSANLVQEFEAQWSADQLESHLEAGRRVDQVRRAAFEFAGERVRNGVNTTEYEVQQFIRKAFEDAGLFTDHGPIVAVNSNASDAHYEPTRDRHSAVKACDLLLIDLWAKLKNPGAVYYDVTWTGFLGPAIPDQIQNVFQVVRDARKSASQLVVQRFSQGQEVFGWEVDDAARGHIRNQGFGEYFIHRTGHSIGTEVHGNGANMDNFESHDDRKIIAETCFSIEPGVYLPAFGIRSEVNVFAGSDRAFVTGEEQEHLVEI